MQEGTEPATAEPRPASLCKEEAGGGSTRSPALGQSLHTLSVRDVDPHMTGAGPYKAAQALAERLPGSPQPKVNAAR